MIKNYLSFSRRFIFTLFTAFISVNLWGQEPINLANCTIGIGNIEDDFYLQEGSSNINIGAVTVYDMPYDQVNPAYYTVSFVYNDGSAVSHLVNEGDYILSTGNKGKYTVIVTGDGEHADNFKKQDFFVNSSNSFPSPQDGSSSNPYLISNEDDWITLAYLVYEDYSATSGKYYKLNQHVTLGSVDGEDNITRNGLMIGDDDNSFGGIFVGNEKTLTFYYSGSNWGIAPFYDIDGATIENLTIDGRIVANGGGASGLAYINYSTNNTTTVNQVTVSVDIEDANNDGYCGGFVVTCSDGLSFSECIYNGKIVTTSNSGGFCASYGSGESTFTDCIFDPADNSSITGGNTFGAVDDESTDITNCYYTDKLGTTEQGVKAFLNAVPVGNIGKYEKQIQSISVYKAVTVTTTAEETYLANGTNYYDEIMACTVYFDNNQANSECEVSITDELGGSVNEQVINKGTYKLVITTKTKEGRVYFGSETKTFYVVDDLTGKGTSAEPYLIRSSADWYVFANKVNSGATGYATAYYKLTANIATSVMVGTSEHPFSGDFSGRIGNTYGAYTLTFNCGSSYYDATSEEIVAPFRYTDGATITSLIIEGAIHTKAGKEAGLIGVNTFTTERATTLEYIINNMDFYCYEELWDAEGGGYAYDGSNIHFSYCSYEGTISASNYHGGFCGKANGNTTFARCLFDPEGGMYWAENFVYDAQGADINYDGPNPAVEDGCYYSLGNNQEESEQGTMVYVNVVPEENIGHKITTFHEKQIYVSVPVVISGANKRYIYNNGNELLNISEVGVTINEIDAIANNLCSKEITNSSSVVVTSVCDKGTYTLTIAAPKEGVESDYKGTVTQLIRVMDPSSTDWTALQAQLSAQTETITIALSKDITAGPYDPCLVIESGKTVTINMNGFKIDRGFYNGNDKWDAPVVGGHVMKIASGATVIINGGTGGTITGGCNKGSSNTEHAENSDGGGIFNMGNLTLNNVTIQGNYCEKYSAGISRTARGGGIYSGKGSTLVINNCTITHNKAQGGGGGLYAERAAVFMMTNTTVQSNSSLDKGGGIRLDANGTKHLEGNNQVANALISGCTIENNTVELHTAESASNGGGIHHDDGTLDLVNCTIERNNSSKYGGGIYIMKGTINATNCNISYNRSYDSSNKFEGYGGGVCLLGGSFKMIGGTVTGNSSYKENGGGVFVAVGKSFTIQGAVRITENWTYDNESLNTRHTTNVYLVGVNDKINISGSIEGASVGVSKKGDTGQFTKGLDGNGSVANFTSDNTTYQILPYTDTSVTPNKSEAKIGNPASWNDNPTPVDDKIIITEPTIINKPVTVNNAYTIEFSGDGCLIIGPNGVLTAKINNNDPLKLIIEDGGQVITTSTVKARVKKEILAFSATQPIDNWYLISSPISSPKINTETDLITYQTDWLDPTTPSYDLYRFNEAATETNAQGLLLQWENYRSTPVHAGFNVGNDASVFEDGRGYLYRNYYDYTITIDGTLTVGNVASYTLTNTGTNDFKGFNLIGNPYSHNIKKGEGQAIPNTYLEGKYYVLNPTGCQWVLTDDGTVIPPLTGILVQAKSDVSATQTLTISDIAPLASKGVNTVDNNNIWFTVANNKYEDKACVEFKEGRGLNKIAHMNEDAPMLYINYNGEDFASVDMDPEAKQFDLYFEAATLGQYTLTVNPQGNYSYLHLIDKVAEEDIDLLKENEYSFIGSPSDNADRFVVRLENSENAENSVFAYQSGNEIIVSGEGELQVFDVMGRLVARQYVSGVVTWRTASLPMGVYIFRLNDKSQKIVIR